MKLKKTLIYSFLTMSLSTTPFLTHAADLTIVNNTNYDSTSRINNGPCSVDILQEGGITRAHRTNIVKSNVVAFACAKRPRDCTADVYMKNHCQGDKIATVHFDTKTGISSIIPGPSTDGFKLTGKGFYIEMNGGPSEPAQQETAK